MGAFWARVLRLAWADTIKFLGLSWARIMRTLLIVGVTSTILWWFGEGTDKLSAYGAVAIAVPLAVLVTFLVNFYRAPAKLYAEQAQNIAALQKDVDGLKLQLAQRKAKREDYEGLRALYDEADIIRYKELPKTLDDDWKIWAHRVDDWRDRTRNALPSEKDSFWNVYPPERFHAVNLRTKVILLDEQLNKLRLILARIEEEVR